MKSIDEGFLGSPIGNARQVNADCCHEAPRCWILPGLPLNLYFSRFFASTLVNMRVGSNEFGRAARQLPTHDMDDFLYPLRPGAASSAARRPAVAVMPGPAPVGAVRSHEKLTGEKGRRAGATDSLGLGNTMTRRNKNSRLEASSEAPLSAIAGRCSMTPGAIGARPRIDTLAPRGHRLRSSIRCRIRRPTCQNGRTLRATPA